MLTTKDWIARARAGDAPAAALAEGELVARFGDDWNDLAEAWLEQKDPDAARRVIAAGLDHNKGEHWPCRNAAALLIQRLDDPDGALAALRRIEAALSLPERDRPPSYQWVSLAESYRDVIGHPDDARRCLAIATSEATAAKDLADLSAGYVNVLADPDGARALLERAEQQVRNGGDLRDLWDIAIRWKETLHDEARARAALAIGTAESTSVSTLTALATAWRSLFNDAPALRGALARGESVAATSEEWLSLAEAWQDGGDNNRPNAWDPVGVRRCLDAALACDALAPDPRARSRIAAGYLSWLGDVAAAEEVAPIGRAPEDLATRERTLDGWDGSEPRALLHRLREQITPKVVEKIAQADYGMAWVKHHRALQAIVATGLQPIPLEWHPAEVLALTRWSQGADVDHVARALACTVLALDRVLPESRHGLEGINDVIAPLVESAWALGLDDELERLLVWLAEVARCEESWPLLALVLHRARRAPDDPRLAVLIELIDREEGRHAPSKPDAGWLFRTTNHDICHDLWLALAAEALAPGRALPPHLERLRDRLRSSP